MPALLIFILFPLLELWLMIQVGGAIGALTTVLLVVFTALLGLTLLRIQGLSALLRAQARMQAGEAPVEELVQGVFLAAGGLLLLVPGFITDFLGFLCLTPGIRQGLVALFLRRSRGFRPAQKPNPDVIEGEFRRE
ncbi:FxsA family protein [Simiduia agarivorans]|uniref:FxsA cytoplasmic membrane family protein n=1 Tax=Simiduia agarivorans (strain DSM 21679 / JCM 13881 / BCRC 17597 / SA1) TaxID=1117647 RepID=K4KR42_SIMAS|nr:FxsA family protein [Simiduia agarivorans]AFV00726.1 FxsA cytoplasmic membrane family protein [Simiduia agarivorans SA1 = DSM 21679]